MNEALGLSLLSRRLKKRKQNFQDNVKTKKNRRWWVRPVNLEREKNSEIKRLMLELKLHDEEWFFTYTRMTPGRFDDLLNIVGPKLENKSIRKPLSPSARLAITLRFLPTGDSYFSIANGYRTGKSTVCTIIQEVTEVIWLQLEPLVLALPDTEYLEKVSKEFLNKWNMPNCIRSIDGKHIKITAPPGSGSLYYNYKNYFSIILLGVCDADYNFLYVDIGSYGSVSDGGVFKSSALGKAIKNSQLPIPNETVLPGSDIMCNYFFVGDAAFPLGKNLIRPYSGKTLDILKSVCNYRISRARRVIENTFGILVARWRIFNRTICAHPNTADKIVKAAVCLHNFIRQSDASRVKYMPDNYVDKEEVLGQWREEVNCAIFQNCRRLGSNNASRVWEEQRFQLAKYFLTPAGFKEGQIEYAKRI